jgi:hypothetical protein
MKTDMMKNKAHSAFGEKDTVVQRSNLSNAIIAAIAFFLIVFGASPLLGETTDDGIKPVSKPSAESQEKNMVVVHYFHRTLRCTTCMTIEELTRASVQENFAREISSGEVKLEILNMEEERNRHFETDYQLSAQSVIVSKVLDGVEVKWKNLDKIWDYVEDGEFFMEYIKGEIESYL